MTGREEVDRFLKDFSHKMGFWGLLIRVDRTDLKNTTTLLALEFNHANVKRILVELKSEDYSQGPLTDKLYGRSDMWVFGKTLKGREVYIKIQLGLPRSETLCISFHFAEHRMNYPFKK
jgi:hypothetical protein